MLAPAFLRVIVRRVLSKVDLGRLRQNEQSHNPQCYPNRDFFGDTGHYQGQLDEFRSFHGF